ncbi:MAG TPA: VWA domain-containing protein [Flavobacteriales bacterium]|nr:VWA domain-containing protein [Flavobacteriales bacterium]
MSEWFSWSYKNPLIFLFVALPVILLVLWFVLQTTNRGKTIKISSLKNFAYISPVSAWRFVLPVLRVLALAFLVVALARPQDAKDDSYREFYSEGIDIVLAFDVSTSMLAMDFAPNRLEAARDVAIDFIDKRKNDRIGLVIFEGEAFTQCPLTTDKNVLKSQFRLAEPGMMAQGTAIGMGLAVSVNRLRESTAKSKVIVLLTDGVNNQGNIDPVTAADIAKEFGIRVYTIGVGKKGKAKYPVPDIFGNITYQYMPVEIDEVLLKDIAKRTGGEYYRATDKNSLQEIYNKIDQLEKSKMNVIEYREDPPERFHIFVLIALALFGLELILKNTLFKSPLW